MDPKAMRSGLHGCRLKREKQSGSKRDSAIIMLSTQSEAPTGNTYRVRAARRYLCNDISPFDLAL